MTKVFPRTLPSGQETPCLSLSLSFFLTFFFFFSFFSYTFTDRSRQTFSFFSSLLR